MGQHAQDLIDGIVDTDGEWNFGPGFHPDAGVKKSRKIPKRFSKKQRKKLNKKSQCKQI